jgi:cytochrome d ubiquinol oxidase subunit II
MATSQWKRPGRDALRLDSGNSPRFRSNALLSGVAVGLLAFLGAAALGVRSPLILLSAAAAGLVSLALLIRRSCLAVRATGAFAVVTVFWGAAAMSGLDLDASVAQDPACRQTRN